MTEGRAPGHLHLDRRTLLKGAGALGAAALVPQNLRAAGTETPRAGGTLRLTTPFNPGSLDPMTGRNLTDFDTLYAVFDALIDFEPNTLTLRPGLARAWRFTNPTTLVLDLVDGVTFHDGTPFNPEAAVFNLERYRTDKRSNVKADLNAVSGVEVTGKNQVTLHMSRPNSGLTTILTNRVGLMVSPAWVKQHGPNIDRSAVGTGPFKFVSWEDNASIALVKNDKYWKTGRPYLDGIQFRIINELNTAARAVIAGEADLALNLQTQQKAVADRAKNVVSATNPSLIFFGAFLNYARPPFSDVRIRQALNYAIDREEINKVVVLGLGEPSSAVLPKEHWACDPATADYYRHDPDKAKKLLAEAGHAGGIEIHSWGWPDQSAMQRQELIISQVAKAGIRIKLTPVTPSHAMTNFMVEKRGDMHISPTGGFPDPSQQYEALFAASALRNAGKIELPGFRPLMDATESAQDQEGRKAAFVKLQRFVIENALQLPQYFAPGVIVATPKVKNFVNGLLNTPKWDEVWLAA